MSKVFFTDLDGTLVNDMGKVGSATREAVINFINRGNYFVICSGRALFGAQEVFCALNIPPRNCFIAAYNGSQIYDCEADRVISSCTIPTDVAQSIYDLAYEYGIHIQAYDGRHLIARRRNKYTDLYLSITSMDLIESDDLTSVLSAPTCKLLAIEPDDKSGILPFLDKVSELYGDLLKIFKSSSTFYEIIRRDSGKGTAVTRLCDLLEIPIENTIGAGDEENDLEMLQTTNYSIAMANAVDAVKAAADVITENDNNHDGLVPNIDRF